MMTHRPAWTPDARAAAVHAAEVRAGLVTLAAAPAADERGYSGTPVYGGAISGDELDRVAAWKLPTRWTTIDKMLGDADVAAVLWALTLPILSVPLAVEPGSDEAMDQDIAATLERDLDNMTRSWAEHRAEMLDYLAWGNRVFETVFERGSDGLWHPRKLALRPSETILYWHADEHGGPDGVTQQLQTGGQQRLDMDRLLVFARGRRGGDLTGTSILRPAYGAWLVKDRLARIGAVAVERHGTGVPTLRYSGKNAANKSNYESMLMGLHAHEKAYLLLAEGVESMGDFELKGVSGTVLDPVAQLEYHRRALYSATLTQFLLLGSGDVGSFALSKDQSSFFILALNAIMREIEDVYNRYLIPRWVGYNWAGVPADRMPRLVHGSLDTRDVEAWFRNVQAGVTAGAVALTPELRRLAHDLLGAPLPEETDDQPAVPVADVNAPDDEGAAYSVALASRPRLESLVKLEALGLAVDFDRMTRKLDETRDRIAKKLTPMQERAARYAASRGWKVVQSGDPSLLDAIAWQDDQEAAAITEALWDMYGDGIDEAAGELDQIGYGHPDPSGDREDDDRGLLGAAAAQMAHGLTGRMQLALAAVVLRQIITRSPDRDGLLAAVTGAPESLLQSIGAQGAGLALGLGRWAAMDTAGVKRVLYTAAMDANTCAECAGLDGQEFDAANAPSVPLAECAGGSLCRCALVAIE